MAKRGHVLCDADNFVDDMINAWKSSRLNDVELSLSDGSKVQANKFVLASRSKYFATMFYGSLKHDGTVPLTWCSKTSMEKVLDFISVGDVDIGDLKIMDLLELLEAARLLCLDVLYKFVESFIDSRFASDGEMSPGNALMALDYAISKQLESVTTWILQFIDRNILDFGKVKPEEAGVLTTNGLITLLGYKSSANRIDMLKFFVIWKEMNQDATIDITQYVKVEELNVKELKVARAHKIFPAEEIMDNLEMIATDYEAMIRVKDQEIQEHKATIRAKEQEIRSLLFQAHSFTKEVKLYVRKTGIMFKRSKM